MTLSKVGIVALLSAIMLNSACVDVNAESGRKHIKMDFGWRFLKEKPNSSIYPISRGFNDGKWRMVQVPHDYIVEGNYTPIADPGHGSLPNNIVAWYRKSFRVDSGNAGKDISIEFDGVYRNASVWLNGHYLGNHPCGYTGFNINITRYVLFNKKNTLAVRVDPGRNEGWWYEGGGIYRHVWLNVVSPAHVARYGVFVTNSVRHAEGNRPSAVSIIRTTIQNSGKTRSRVTISTVVFDPAGRALGELRSPASPVPHGAVTIQQKFHISNAKLWSLETPRLYKVVTRIIRNGATIDKVATPYGIRTIHFSSKGFFLNGKHVEIKGSCNHQDFAGVGIGMPDNIIEWRIRKLKAMGSNAYRTSHNEVASELLDACDRLGMLVMDENRHAGDTENPKADWLTSATDNSSLKEMVTRDRNHPCIFLWSMANEEWNIQNNEIGERIGKALKRVFYDLDGTRPVTAAINGGYNGGFTNVVDIEGFNYNFWAYDRFHREHPGRLCIGSETASTVATRGIYADDAARGYVTAYDTSRAIDSVEDAWQNIAQRPYMTGAFIWTGFDYKGEPTPYKWPCVNSHFGAMDICGFPKDNYYYYKIWWSDKPMSHLFPHWNWSGGKGRIVPVWAYGNTQQVELFLNGKSLGRKSMPKYRHVEWNVRYTPGIMVLKGYNKGRVVTVDKVATTGAPAALRLSCIDKTIKADGQSIAVIETAVVDSKGRVVPTANNLVSYFAAGQGDIVGVGNGDPSCHEPDKARRRHAFNGLCVGLAQSNDRRGTITVTARSRGLKSATIRIKAI